MAMVFRGHIETKTRSGDTPLEDYLLGFFVKPNCYQEPCCSSSLILSWTSWRWT